MQLSTPPGTALAAIEDVLYEEGAISKDTWNKIKAEKEKEEAEKAKEMTKVSEKKEKEFSCFYKDGFKCQTADKKFKYQFGGRLHLDYAFGTGGADVVQALGDPNALGDGAEFRRVYLTTAGTIYDTVKFKAQFDFSGQKDDGAGKDPGNVEFKDVYLEFINLPYIERIGSVRVGHFKEPFSLEEQTSDRFTTFLERGLPGAANPVRNNGIMLHNAALQKRVTYAAGVFLDADDVGDTGGEGLGEGKYNFTGRVTALPLYQNKGEKLAHVGISWTHRNPLKSQARLRRRPETHQAERFVDTGVMANIGQIDFVDLEGALVWGPFSVQSQYLQGWLDNDAGSDPYFFGYYVFGSYFLTGEYRRYKTSGGKFDRIRPKKNFLGTRGGTGAWQVAFRYSYLNLDQSNDTRASSGNFLGRGGRIEDYTLGLNWYLNPNARLMWNAVISNTEDSENLAGGTLKDGWAQFYQMRFQVDF